MKNHIAAAIKDNKIFYKKFFDTAEEAYQCQLEWAECKHMMPGCDSDYIARFSNGMLMTTIKVEH